MYYIVVIQYIVMAQVPQIRMILVSLIILKATQN